MGVLLSKAEGIDHAHLPWLESPPACPRNLKPTLVNLQSTHRGHGRDSKSRFHSLFFLNPAGAFLQHREQLLPGDHLFKQPFPVSIWIVFHKRIFWLCSSFFLECCPSRIIAAFPIETRSHRKNVCQTSVNSCSIQTWLPMAPGFLII